MGVHSPNIIANSLISILKYHPQGEYIITEDRRITWKQIIPRMFKIAQALKNLGISKNDKVAFMFHNTSEFIEINSGIQIAGAIPVPINYRFIVSEIEYQANHSESTVLIYDSLWAENVEPALANMPNIAHIICRGDSNLGRVIPYDQFIDSGSDQDPAVPTAPDDVAVIIYTGGTTGFPKGVMLSYQAHFNMFATMGASTIVRTMTADIPQEKHKRMIELLPIPGKAIVGAVLRSQTFKRFMSRPGVYEFLKDRIYKIYTDPDVARRRYGKSDTKSMSPSMPYFHVASYQALIGAALSGNATVVLTESPRFDPQKILELVQREQVQLMANVPTGWQKLVSFPQFDRYDVSSIRMASNGGGVCTPQLKKKILEKFPNALVMDVLGQTEMTPIISFRLDSDPEDIADRSVGKAIVEAKIVDEEGKELLQGEIGEICYRSDTMMKGYYRDEAKTQEVMEGGWFRSGDLGYFDENGEIRTVDRKKECINTGGEKVFPLEVEEIIQSHPKVEMAVVIGVPDEQWGSTVRAVIQLIPGESMEEREIMDFCRGKMAGYKTPRSVIFVEEIPISPVGKVLRQKIRDQYSRPDFY